MIADTRIYLLKRSSVVYIHFTKSLSSVKYVYNYRSAAQGIIGPPLQQSLCGVP